MSIWWTIFAIGALAYLLILVFLWCALALSSEISREEERQADERRSN